MKPTSNRFPMRPPSLPALLMDIQFAFRQWSKHPGFTVVAVLTVALGVGANTAIFSVVDAVLLKALPYRDPDRLVMLWTDNPALKLGFHELPPAAADLTEWRRLGRSFEQIAVFRSKPMDLAEPGETERLAGVQVTANLFPLLGIQPLLGRGFSVEDERLGQDKVVVLSHRLWQGRFAGDPQILQRSLTLNHERCAIIGVMPPGFDFPHGTEMPAGYALMARTEIWSPYAEKEEYWRSEDTRDLIAMGRLRPGVTLAQAQAEMTVVARREAEAYPKSHTGWTIHLQPLARQVAGKTRPVLIVLLGAVGFVLLIACGNVASLLLCRAASRRKEMAVRAALGAGRGRILRQLITESLLLSGLGGAAGLLVGAWGIRVLLNLSPAQLPRLHEIALDGRVFLFSVLLSLAAGLIFGLAPAWQATRITLSEVLSSEGRSGSASGRHRVHRLLVIVEVTLAVDLLMGAGLMLQSFRRLQSVDPGFRPERVATFDVTLNGPAYLDWGRIRQFYRDARQQLRHLPGVRNAAAISNLPLGEVENVVPFFIEGAPRPGSGQDPFAENRKVTPGYFETMNVPLLQGRDFNDQDDPQQPPRCLINATMARQFFAGVDPIGKRLKMARAEESDRSWFTIVGVASDVRSYGLDVQPRPQVYTTVEQNTDNEMTFVVRAETGPPAALERAVRAEMKKLDPGLPLVNFRAMESLVNKAMARPRFGTLLMCLFAATALLLTVVGLYGVVAFAVSERTREIGIRMALGADRPAIRGLVLRQGMVPALTGLGFGVAGALALTRVLANQLYEVRAGDPLTFAAVVLLLLLVALAACWIPARRATRVDPIEALRHD